jgi:hypothetical protein
MKYVDTALEKYAALLWELAQGVAAAIRETRAKGIRDK